LKINPDVSKHSGPPKAPPEAKKLAASTIFLQDQKRTLVLVVAETWVISRNFWINYGEIMS
jgi:hypothetical protein